MPCLICQSMNISKVSVNSGAMKTKDFFSYDICNECFHIKINLPLCDSNLGRNHLKLNIEADATPSKEIISRAKKIISMANNHKKNLNIYELGSGNCKTSQAFTLLGHNGIAVDIDRFNPGYKNFIFFSELEGVLKDLNPDVYFSNHVFEHLEQDEFTDMLQKLLPYMQTKGVCYFVLPLAKQSLISKGVYLEEFVSGHKNLYTRKSIEKLIFSLDIFNEIELMRVEIIKHRLIFLKSRVHFFFNLLSSAKIKQALALGKYIARSLIVGNSEELAIFLVKK